MLQKGRSDNSHAKNIQFWVTTRLKMSNNYGVFPNETFKILVWFGFKGFPEIMGKVVSILSNFILWTFLTKERVEIMSILQKFRKSCSPSKSFAASRIFSISSSPLGKKYLYSRPRQENLAEKSSGTGQHAKNRISSGKTEFSIKIYGNSFLSGDVRFDLTFSDITFPADETPLSVRPHRW